MQQLEEGMGRLASVSAEVEASLAEVQAALKEERTRQQQFQVKVIPVVSSVFKPPPRSGSAFKITKVKDFQSKSVMLKKKIKYDNFFYSVNKPLIINMVAEIFSQLVSSRGVPRILPGGMHIFG